MLWIIDNALDKRNLSPVQEIELGLKREEIVAEAAAKRMRAGKTLDPRDNCRQGRTADIIGKAAGGAAQTVP